MSTSNMTFARLRRLLLDLEFAEKEVPDSHIMFEHVPSDTVFIFRPYRPQEKVSPHDVVGVRYQLDWRGLLDAEAFNNLLRKASA